MHTLVAQVLIFTILQAGQMALFLQTQILEMERVFALHTNSKQLLN